MSLQGSASVRISRRGGWFAGLMVALIALLGSVLVAPQPANADWWAGPYALENRASGQCADAAGWSKERGSRIIQWHCHGGKNQQWWYIDKGKEGKFYKNVHSGLCMDLAGWSKTEGAKMIQWTCHWGENQQWRTGRPVTAGGNWSWEEVNVWSRMCLDVPSGSSEPGLHLQQWFCNGHWAQGWAIYDPSRY